MYLCSAHSIPKAIGVYKLNCTLIDCYIITKHIKVIVAMRFMKLLSLAVVAVLASTSCGTRDEATRMLVLYYSQSSNTKAVAEEIATRLGADIEEIVPTMPYDGDFQATIDRCKRDRELGVLPAIRPLKADIEEYDYVFIGYPIWFGTYAPPIAALLSEVDLGGKKVVPFCTFGSGGLESSIDDLRCQEPNAELLPGYGVRAARMAAMPQEVEQWLKACGLIEGEYVRPADFAEQHPVSDEEAALFDAAVGGYPMIHAKATMAASRATPGGVEYLFTAVDLPREDNPDMPPAGEMKVYVTVAEGGAPEFTRVVR